MSSESELVTSYPLTIDDKGRTTLPSAMRAVANIEPGETLTARVEAEGRVVIETREFVMKRMRKRARESLQRIGFDGDIVESLFEDRATDQSL